ncbi:MAG: hypothetical protein ACOH10_05955 [Rhodoglobus sp.]|uniref:hypothetical protein n=1 Tax=Salinibacterium sp. G-O1 TaxID=3046208 RepID=UPI0024B8E2F4|nr:hypothetical protein [Salinibacterium sp. G-O1]MDJ0335774.1 hypothetical protein [Salinibacterium sp. G-O1]
MPTLDLIYESQRWLMLPLEFPDGPDASLEEWTRRIAGKYKVAAEWSEPPYDALLPRHLEDQFTSISPERTAALWYCPYGLPAVAYVHIALSARPGGEDVTAESLVSELSSEIVFELQPVTTAHLGDGVAFSRIRAGETSATGGDDLPGYAEAVYVFLPGESMLVVTARSIDPAVIGLMGEELWNIVESMVIND